MKNIIYPKHKRECRFDIRTALSISISHLNDILEDQQFNHNYFHTIPNDCDKKMVIEDELLNMNAALSLIEEIGLDKLEDYSDEIYTKITNLRLMLENIYEFEKDKH